jgi:hypothetical protein
VVIAELLATLGVEVDQKSLAKADSALDGVAKNASKILGGIAAIFGGATAAGFIKELIAIGGELDDATRRFGVTAQYLQGLRFAAAQAGAPIEAVGNAIKFAAKNAYDAATGGKESAEAFRELGVAVVTADGAVRSTDAVFDDTLNALAGVENNTERTALALKVLGRGATDLLPLISAGADGIAALRAQFEELGGGYSDEFVAQADALGDSIDALSTAGQSLKSTFGLAVFPVIQRGVDILLNMGKGFNRIIKGTRLVKMALAAMTAGFVAWGAAALWAARQAIMGWLAAAAPFLLVGVALAALALILDDIAALLTGGKSLIGKYLDEWFGVGTADALVRNWTAGIEVLTETVSALGDLTAKIATDVVTFWGAALSELGGLWTTGIDVIMGKVRAFAGWILDIGMKIAGALDPTGTLTDTIKKHYGNLKSVIGSVMPDMPDLPFSGPGPVSATDRVNRDGSQFFDFAANPGVAAPDAVHPAFRPGTVDAPAGAGNTTVDASTHAPITVNGATDPRATAREIRRELDARDAAQAERVKRALVNRPKAGG